MKRVLRLLKKYRNLRQENAALKITLFYRDREINQIRNDFDAYRKQVDKLFKYSVTVIPDHENRLRRITLSLSDVALTTIREPDALICDIATKLYRGISKA